MAKAFVDFRTVDVIKRIAIAPALRLVKADAFACEGDARAGSGIDIVVHDCIGCGNSSGVEHRLAKARVEGSNPFSRSNFSR
jgi:hypothetical protein